jgi:hypothetical protein
VRVLSGGKFVVMSGGGTWPTPMDLPDDSLEWRLRYANDNQLVKDRFCAASIVSAYRQLITLPRKAREEVIRELRAGIKAARQSEPEGNVP